MLVITFTLVLFVQAGCEWVQISQQHYKKPLRPAHDHPLLATVKNPSETTRPTHSNSHSVKSTVEKTSDRPRPTEEHEVSPVVKVIDVERTTKRNRIYINHTLQDSWDSGVIDFNEQHEFVSRKPSPSDEIIRHGTESKGDILLISRPKPDNIENSAITDKSVHRTPIPGNVMRVHPTTNKGSHKTLKPLEEYKGPIEIMNMADLEYTTSEDTYNMKIDKDIVENNDKRKQAFKTNTSPKEIDKMKKEPPKNNDERNQARPNHETGIKQPTALKGITNMRRVEILRSTKPTLTEEYDEIDSENISVSPKPELMSEEYTNINKATSTGVTPYKFPIKGHVNRVHKANTTRSTRKPNPVSKHMTPQYVNEEDYSTEQSEEMVKHISRIDPPLRKSTTEKSVPVRTKPALKISNQNRKVPSPEDVMQEELIAEDEKQLDIRVHKVASIGTIKRVPNPTKIPEANTKKIHRHDDPIRQSATTTPEKDFDEDVTIEDEYSEHTFNDQNKNNYYTSSAEEIPIHSTVKSKQEINTATRRPEINPQIEKYGPNPYKPSKMTENIKTEDDFEYDVEYDTTTESSRNTNRHKMNSVSSNRHNTKRKDNQFKNNAVKDFKHTEHDGNVEEEDENEEPLSNNKKSNAMETLIKFLKTVTEIIARNTRRGVHGKVRYLEDLRDTLMANIEERIEAAFPDDPPVPSVPGSRRERSAEPRGHVEFPSSEGALMTISFLTFAVFLIKLVLQVIQAYKNKTMMMMPTVVAAVGRAYNARHTNN